MENKRLAIWMMKPRTALAQHWTKKNLAQSCLEFTVHVTKSLVNLHKFDPAWYSVLARSSALQVTCHRMLMSDISPWVLHSYKRNKWARFEEVEQGSSWQVCPLLKSMKTRDQVMDQGSTALAIPGTWNLPLLEYFIGSLCCQTRSKYYLLKSI